MLVFAVEARYHIGIWFCECELGRRVIASFCLQFNLFIWMFDSKIKIIWL